MMLLTDYHQVMSSDLNDETSEVLYTSEFTDAQKELVQKFNSAFYEAQSHQHRSHQIGDHENILETFDEKYFTNIESYEEGDHLNGGDGYFFDFLVPEASPNLIGADAAAFDYDDFCEKFEQQVSEKTTAAHLSQYGIIIETPTDDDFRGVSATSSDASPFFVPLPFETKVVAPQEDDLEHLDLSDIDLSESVSNASLDLDNLADFYDYGCKTKLPPVNTIVRNGMDFTNRLRSFAGAETLLHFEENHQENNYYGHLIGNENNNSVSIVNLIDEEAENNQAIMRQTDALLYDDPLLSSSSLILPCRRTRKDTEESELSSTDCDETYAAHLQCKWENCFQIYECQTSLVKHIEKYHVELKRGEEFTCFWLNCPRKNKPFNARYKLLIHMRVHSGEKPNKCPFGGCNKAFSRLENLKIHQRSHTGERPYLCQISNCTKSFSNSSDRAKHQRTHFDTKPYACQVTGCSKKYTDPSSLRKHVKNHSYEEQIQLKKKSAEYKTPPKDATAAAAAASLKRTTEVKRCGVATTPQKSNERPPFGAFYTTFEHSYSNSFVRSPYVLSANVKQDLKNKISEKMSKEKMLMIA